MARLTPEGKVKKRLIDMLRRHGVWYFSPANNGLGRSGLPDVIAIVRGQFVGIEVKADKARKPTPLQLLAGRQIKEAGGAWFLVYDDETIAEVEVLVCAGNREG